MRFPHNSWILILVEIQTGHVVFESKLLLNQMNHSTLTWEPQVNLYQFVSKPPKKQPTKRKGPPFGCQESPRKKNTKLTTFPKPSMTTAPATTSGPRSSENARNFEAAAAKNSAVSIATGADYPPSDFGRACGQKWRYRYLQKCLE